MKKLMSFSALKGRSLSKNRFFAELMEGFKKLGRGEKHFRLPEGETAIENEISQAFNSALLQLSAKEQRGQEKKRNGDFSELAHDLRLPVGSLRQLFEVLKKVAPNDNDLCQKSLASMGEELEYLDKLAEHLLALSRINESQVSGTVAATVERVFVKDLIEKWMPSYESLAEFSEKRIRLEWRGPRLELFVKPVLFERMLRNLVENAIEFSSSEVKLVGNSTAPDRVELCVVDDGVGMTGDCVRAFGVKRPRRIFHESSEQKNGRLSLGLGSVIVKRIVEQEGWGLELESCQTNPKIASGTVLKLTLR